MNYSGFTHSKLACYAASVVAFMVTVIACSTESPVKQSTIPVYMRDAYSAAYELYDYVWSEEKFLAEESETKILSLLERLSSDFHQVDVNSSIENIDPGFRVALLTQQNLLRDARTRFSNGQKSYAKWQLKSLSTNCVSCHSRHEVKIDFIGSTPKLKNSSFEQSLAAAQFLFASRQFDRASEELLNLTEQAKTPNQLMEALKLWLVIEVRVKNRFTESSRVLAEIQRANKLGDEETETISAWIDALESLDSTYHSDNRDILSQTKDLILEVEDEQIVHEQEKRLPQVLLASSMLHQFLTPKLNNRDRKEASFLLALAYSRLPIRSLEVFQPLYLEQCIREFPDTVQARKAFKLYRQYIEVQYSGSGGLHLDEEEQERLDELRSIAHGRI